MKARLTALAAVLCIGLLFTSCVQDAQNDPSTTKALSQTSTQTQPTTLVSTENTTQEYSEPVSEQMATTAVIITTTATTAITESYISETTSTSAAYDYIGTQAAKQVALSDAGLNESDVHFTEVSLDVDDGNICYSVEFYSGIFSYEYDIDAISGIVLERSREVFD